MNGLLDRSSGYLFSSFDLREEMERRIVATKAEVSDIAGNRLLNTSPADLTRYLVNKYGFEVPRLMRDRVSADATEVQIDMDQSTSLGGWSGSRKHLIPGQRFVIEVPVEGDMDLFFARPSTFNFSPPKARIEGSSLFLVFNILHNSPHHDVKGDLERSLEDIERWIATIRRDLQGFDQRLIVTAEHAISERRTRLLTYEGRMASLGIPLKPRSDAPKTYSLPNVRRKIPTTLPQASTSPFQPEPTLDDAQYEHILSVLQHMTLAIERSPSAFRTMREEDIRQHFLIQLNGQFEGQATAETFNVTGKTDILIRAQDRNVFIAECKFWKGSKQYLESIDQLLSYKAWRDTKTAILVFNRSTSMSAVCEAIRNETVKHPNFKRQIPWKHETGFRYVFHHTEDSNREFLLTVLVFDVPGPVDEPN